MKNQLMSLLLFLLGIILLSFIKSPTTRTTQDKIENTIGFKVLKILKRESTVYTQGLFFDSTGDFLYESGGLYDISTIKKLHYPSLEVAYAANLEKTYFAEGIAQCGKTIYQLTWQENVILKYDSETLEALGGIPMDTKMREGWGLSEYENGLLIASDGSSNIYFLDCAKDLKVKSNITVTNENGKALKLINELVYAKGYIYANVYFDKSIYKIDPKNGKVIKSYYMSPLVDFELRKGTLSSYALNSGDVLNGIAYDSKRDVFLITGKRWGFFYEVEFE